MAHLPDEIEDKNAVKAKGWTIAIGVVSGLLSWGAFSNGDAEAGFWLALICAGLVFIGSKIKTTKKLGGGIYTKK